MKRVIVTDANGWQKAYIVKDDAEDTRFGIPNSPPDLNELNWDEIKQELNNLLTQEGITTWQDIQNKPDLFQGIVLSVVRNRIVNLYKIKAMEVDHVRKQFTNPS